MLPFKPLAGAKLIESEAMNEISHRMIETNGIRMHVAEKGAGPLVILCHGFPESWYSWRHQIEALSAAGFHAVAPDMRGYGQTESPQAIDQFTLLHLVGDVIGLLDALGVETAVIAGHDWGAPVAWHAALLRPDRFRAVIGLSVPFIPRSPDYPSKSYPQTDDTYSIKAISSLQERLKRISNTTCGLLCARYFTKPPAMRPILLSDPSRRGTFLWYWSFHNLGDISLFKMKVMFYILWYGPGWEDITAQYIGRDALSCYRSAPSRKRCRGDREAARGTLGQCITLAYKMAPGWRGRS